MDRVLAPDLWHTLGGVLALNGHAFADSVVLRHGPVVAFLIVVFAGISSAFGQSVVLFANRVKPGRFAFSLLVNALLFSFGYAFLTLSTWASARLSGIHIPLGALWIVLAVSYAPLLFSFFEMMPYLGIALTWILRIWALLAEVVGVTAISHVTIPIGFTIVFLGWFGMVVAMHTLGKPIAALGVRLTDAAAGVTVDPDEEQALDRARSSQLTGAYADASSVHGTNAPIVVATHDRTITNATGWLSILGMLAMAALVVLVAIASAPVHAILFGWDNRISAWLRWPFDLAWISLVAAVAAAMLAPLETLGWWAGWYGDEIQPRPDARSGPSATSDSQPSRYLIYLDGIGQSSGTYTPDVETFLDALGPTIPKRMKLIRGLIVYSVLNRPLDDDPILAWFWSLIDKVRIARPSSVLGMLINLRNVMIVAVSADPRYGPIYNFGIAKVLYDGLIDNGYRPRSGVPVTLIGYSGGAQMSAASACFLTRAIDAPVDIISLGGIISGGARVLEIGHLYHLVGDNDNIERLGPILFWSRWRIFWLSYWNRAKRTGRLTRMSLGPVGHQVPGGMFDPNARLPNGQTNLAHTVADIGKILRGRLESAGAKATLPQSNYGLYSRAPWNDPSYYPIGRSVDSANYAPVANWMGRLILPKLDERSSVRGAWFEVYHTDPARARLVGVKVKLRWDDDPRVQERVRAVTRDVFFSADAEYSVSHSGWIEPTRLNHWQLVDPLESLAGSRPNDDVVVMLVGPVVVEEENGVAVLRIQREPAQITGRYYGLVRFVGPAGADRYRVAHFNRTSRAFDGPQEVVSTPPAVADTESRAPSAMQGIERSPVNAEGWYIYGAPDEAGTFVVQSLAPRGALRAQPQCAVNGRAAARRFVRHQMWTDIVARKGTADSTYLDNADAQAAPAAGWAEGDRALVLHTYGGIGGRLRESAAAGPVYWGHFAYGDARIVHDPLADEARFEILFHQVYSHNTDGIVAGTFHWSRFIGDRQYGWGGVRPTCNIMVRLDGFTSEVRPDDATDTSALDRLGLQLEAMTARYRIGDGSGCTYVGPAYNCAQDSNQALFKTLRDFPVECSGPMGALVRDLQRRLNPLGAPRPDWTSSDFNLGGTLEDGPLQQLWLGLLSWRMLFPRYACETIVDAFLKHRSTAWVLATDVIGGERPDVDPIAPMTL